MREIKFRGKRIDGNGWAYGLLAGVGDHAVIASGSQYYQCDKGTVGQFTGLLDKNGREIYEGDVVNCVGHLYAVEYSCDGFGSFDQDGNGGDLRMFTYNGEVIGNIHDNPKPLGGELDARF